LNALKLIDPLMTFVSVGRQTLELPQWANPLGSH
jgi:hypothetical protein